MQPLDFLGTTIVVVGGALVLAVVRFLFNRSIKKASNNSFPYNRQLVTFAIVLVGLFLAVGLLPIAPELKGQILSVLGVLLSAVIALSSTTLVGNAMAGIMLRLMHEFRAGDFIEVEDMIGRVTDFGIFHTEIQMITRDVVSLPNLLLESLIVEDGHDEWFYLELSPKSKGLVVKIALVREVDRNELLFRFLAKVVPPELARRGIIAAPVKDAAHA